MITGLAAPKWHPVRGGPSNGLEGSSHGGTRQYEPKRCGALSNRIAGYTTADFQGPHRPNATPSSPHTANPLRLPTARLAALASRSVERSPRDVRILRNREIARTTEESEAEGLCSVSCQSHSNPVPSLGGRRVPSCSARSRRPPHLRGGPESPRRRIVPDRSLAGNARARQAVGLFDHRIRHGNSLVGILNPAVMQDGIRKTPPASSSA